MSDQLIEEVAEVIHRAKMKECWGWMGKADLQPWQRPNAASPAQPWHDIARAQAKALLSAYELRRKS